MREPIDFGLDHGDLIVLPLLPVCNVVKNDFSDPVLHICRYFRSYFMAFASISDISDSKSDVEIAIIREESSRL